MAAAARTPEWNWAGNYRYRAPELHSPRTLAQLQALVAGASSVRALGSRHSFNALADSEGVLLNLAQLPANITLDVAARQVTVGAGATYGAVATELSRNGFALHNLASLPHISIAGAIATGTHGSGDGNGNLASAVVGLRFVDASGALRTVTAADTPDFAGYVVSLGALGIVTEVTLRVEPSFDVAQHVYTGLSWDQVLADFTAVTSRAYSVSLFTNWCGESVGQLWFKQRLGDGRSTDFPPELLGGRAATEQLHPLPGVSAVNCTPQLGVAGDSAARLSHFRMDYLPSNGDEIQSEYLIPREHAVAAISALRDLGETLAPQLLVAEIRTVAADELWLSANYGRDGVGLHFTWRLDQDAVERLLPLVEAALAPFAARPHWGKVFLSDATTLAAQYPRMADFRALADRVDPTGKFRNAFLNRTVFAN